MIVTVWLQCAIKSLGREPIDLMHHLMHHLMHFMPLYVISTVTTCATYFSQ